LQLLLVEDDRPLAEAICDGVRQQGWQIEHAHVRAMMSPQAAGERFLGVGEFMWMADISRTLREQLGDAASEVPTRIMPDFLFRLFALFDPSLRAMTPRLGKTHRHSAAKAQRLLGWQSRPARATLVDCAASLIAKQAV
jgi:dihydroflavonol-4-reductase